MFFRATEILNKERRKVWYEAHKTAREVPKRGCGRSVKGETTNLERKQAKTVKSLQYVLLRNLEDFSNSQSAQLKFLTEENLRLYRAYLLKESLRLAIKTGPEEITESRSKWMGCGGVGF